MFSGLIRSPTCSSVYFAPARRRATYSSARTSFAEGRRRLTSPAIRFRPVSSSHSISTLWLTTRGHVLPSSFSSTFLMSFSAIDFFGMGLGDAVGDCATDANRDLEVVFLVGFERAGFLF